jgi:hypothetical protein
MSGRDCLKQPTIQYRLTSLFCYTSFYGIYYHTELKLKFKPNKLGLKLDFFFFYKSKNYTEVILKLKLINSNAKLDFFSQNDNQN